MDFQIVLFLSIALLDLHEYKRNSHRLKHNFHFVIIILTIIIRLKSTRGIIVKPGDNINERYQIIEKLGQGSFAVVFLAIDSYSKEKVAIKAVPTEVTYETHMLDEFQDNYKVVYKLKHPNIAAYNTLEKNHQDNQFFLVMEYVEGSDLSTYRKQQQGRKLSLEKTLEILTPIAQALDFAHKKGVVHRDIKPDNIRINSLGEAKILDFGLAAQIKSTVIRRSQTPEMFNDELVGSYPYMAPELLKAKRMKERTLMAADRYAFGIMCYELLDAGLPFESDDANLLKEAICNEPADPVEYLNEAQNNILIKLLAKDPSARYTTTMEFIEALKETLLLNKLIFTATGSCTPGDDDTKKNCIRRAEIDAVTRLLEKTSPLQMRSHSTVEFGELTADEMIAKIDGSLQIIEKSKPTLVNEAYTITIKAKRIEEKPKKKTTGTLDISSEPSSAKIYLNGHYHGQTPQQIEHEAQAIELILKLDGYDDVIEKLRLSASKTLKLPFKLNQQKQAGHLIINSEPDGAKWYLDGELQGITPDRVELLSGQHELKVKKADHNNWLKTVEIKTNKRIVIEAELVKKVKKIPVVNEAKPVIIKPSTKSADEWQDPITGMEFIWVPSGDFMMGSETIGTSSKPVHKVILTQGFWLGKYPVTQGQWKKIMDTNPAHFQNGDNYPVEQVSWDDVKQYIEQLNKQGEGGFGLPTEAQWEYACRSGGKNEEWSGCHGKSQLKNYAWYKDNSGSKTHPVGQKKPNGLGLYDMSGNVWEWVEDWFGGYSTGTLTDPKVDSSGSNRVYRGGSWYSLASLSRSAYRRSDSPVNRFISIGFRLRRT